MLKDRNELLVTSDMCLPDFQNARLLSYRVWCFVSGSFWKSYPSSLVVMLLKAWHFFHHLPLKTHHKCQVLLFLISQKWEILFRDGSLHSHSPLGSGSLSKYVTPPLIMYFYDFSGGGGKGKGWLDETTLCCYSCPFFFLWWNQRGLPTAKL